MMTHVFTLLRVAQYYEDMPPLLQAACHAWSRIEIHQDNQALAIKMASLHVS
ncbi:hypothetical protein GJA_2034 [Janthinobacterium agaricidamnosum NBRC 102515 = DSM 9628]|uniref:Uncharacterized protein n=1 Tax=Janthinobacterium agaricidamnosum NBRC 102515 = DSM 9628 TaxID=1349767 RepID=W0V4Y9_9BURK|nr:hypothetical protein GJA_2034 [Janthinobacterium agaricidamnosum NBRC 102515 = DSM 9628]